MKYFWLFIGISMFTFPTVMLSVIVVGTWPTVVFAVCWFSGVALMLEYVIDKINE